MASEESLFATILLIEDDSSHALLIKRALRGLAESVTHVTGIREALAHLDAHRPALIVTDLNLGSDLAIDFLPELLAKSDGQPIIVLTASTSLNDAVEAMKRGARDFIVKNFDKDFAEVLGFALSRLHVTLTLESERRKLERQIRTLHVAIENSSDGLAVAAEDGAISYANTAFLRFVERCGGLPDRIETLVGGRVKNEEAVSTTVRNQLGALPAGAMSHSEITLKDEKDGGFDLSMGIAETGGEGKEPIHRDAVLWARDITEQRRRQRFQREILSTTTHDLKGPLGAIMTSAELIPQFKKDPEKTDQIALRIGSSAKTALNLIDEFLSARRIQEGNMILKPSAQDLGAVIAETLDDYATMSSAKGIDLVFNRPAEALALQADRIGLIRVLGNLVSNALKFTPRGGRVEVSIRVLGDDAHIIVSDNGQGIEPGEIKKLFGRFSRLEQHHEVAGTGLGLFVTKAIVSAHGGNVAVTSAIGKGTSFDVSLPLKPPVNERGELICLDFE